MAKTWRQLTFIGGGILIAALLGGCGGDTPEAVQESLSQAAPVLAFAEENHAECVSQALLDTVGFETLAQDGHTSTSLTESPDSIVEIMAAYDSDELRTAMTPCFDVDEVFRAHLTRHNNDDAITCDQTFEPGLDLVDEYLQQRFDGDDITLTFPDDDITRDLLRPCLTEASFGSMFNIDDPSALSQAIHAALPTGLSARPCAAETFVDAIGAEQLNHVDISIETAEIDINDLYVLVQERPDVDLDVIKEIEAELSSALAQCNTLVSDKRVELFNDQPLTGECAMDAVASEWADAVVQAELGRASANAPNGVLRTAFDDCARERAEHRSGIVLSEADAREARQFSSLFYADILRLGITDIAATPEMFDCAFYVAAGELGIDTLADLHDKLFASTSEDAAFASYIEIVAAVGNGRYTCEDSRLYLLSDMQRSGFSEETIECVASRSSSLDDLAELHLAITTRRNTNETDIRSYVTHIHSLLDTLEQCHTTAEGQIHSDYLDAIGLGSGLGEPDTSSA